MSFDLLKTVISSSKFCINIIHLNESETLITVMSEYFLERFFTWPRNYYNDNKFSEPSRKNPCLLSCNSQKNAGIKFDIITVHLVVFV